MRKSQVALGLIFTLGFFLVLYPNASVARRLGPQDVLIVVDDSLGLPSQEILEPYLLIALEGTRVVPPCR